MRSLILGLMLFASFPVVASTVLIQGAAADPLTNGQSFTFDDTNSSITYRFVDEYSHSRLSHEVNINVGGSLWSVQFMPPYGERLKPGFYADADNLRDYASEATPAIFVQRPGGVTCDTRHGYFRINAVSFDGNDTVNSLSMDLAHYCNGNEPALIAIRYNNDDPVDLAAFAENPVAPVNGFWFVSDYGDRTASIGNDGGNHFVVDLSGREYYFYRNLLDGVTLSYRGVGAWNFAFAPPWDGDPFSDTELAMGEYVDATMLFDNSNSGDGPGIGIDRNRMLCGGVVGRGSFRVHELEWGEDGSPQKLALDFVYHCSGDLQGPAARGAIRINSTVPVTTMPTVDYGTDSTRKVVLPIIRVLEGGSVSYAKAVFEWYGSELGFRLRELSYPGYQTDDYAAYPTLSVSGENLRIPRMAAQSLFNDPLLYDVTLAVPGGQFDVGRFYDVVKQRKLPVH